MLRGDLPVLSFSPEKGGVSQQDANGYDKFFSGSKSEGSWEDLSSLFNRWQLHNMHHFQGLIWLLSSIKTLKFILLSGLNSLLRFLIFSNCNLFYVFPSPVSPPPASSPARTVGSHHISPTSHVTLQPCSFCISLLSSYFPCSFLLFLTSGIYYHVLSTILASSPNLGEQQWGVVTTKFPVLS